VPGSEFGGPAAPAPSGSVPEPGLQGHRPPADSDGVAESPHIPGVVRVLIADDQRLFAENLRAALATDERIEVVGIARDGAEALELASALLPDLVLMDLQMPVMGGLEATRKIRAGGGRTQVIVLTGVGTSADAQEARAAGAAGYITKDRMAIDLLDSFHEVATIALVFGTIDQPPLDA
jgi:CheY-like chemotaxis protein